MFQSGLPAGAGSQTPDCSPDKVTGIELGSGRTEHARMEARASVTQPGVNPAPPRDSFQAGVA